MERVVGSVNCNMEREMKRRGGEGRDSVHCSVGQATPGWCQKTCSNSSGQTW